MRESICLNREWSFLGPTGAVETVDVPHTWNNVDGQDGGNDYWRGTCTYQKRFPLPPFDPDTQAVYLEFQGVNATADVKLNGQSVIHHDGGYSTFRADVTALLREENHLEVKVDNSVNDRVYPQKADFTFYGGIYRDVKLLIVHKTHFDLDYLPGGIAEGLGAEEPLALTTNERDAIELAKEASDNVIVLVNTATAVEIGDLKNDPEIDAILWTGFPGCYGMLGVADILCGRTSPSGGLFDIFPTYNMSAPAMQNMGKMYYTNTDEEITRTGGVLGFTPGSYTIEAESIYVGYRYYETRYYDSVAGNGNASDPTGAYGSTTEWNYDNEVAFGFGYGLSYARIYPSRIAGVTLDKEDVRYYSLDENGDIDRLILNEVTGDTLDYVYVTSAASSSMDMNTSGTYRYLLDGQSQTLSGSTIYNISIGGAALLYEDGAVKNFQQLEDVTLTELSDLYAMAGNRKYALAEDVQVLLKDSSGNFYATTLSEINAGDYTLTGWYDDLGFAAGGRIRIIIAVAD